MDNGGREAMLYDLLRHDLTDVDLKTFPRTDALMDQITNSMTAIQKFWYEILREGTLTIHNDEWSAEIKSEDLYDRYVEFASKIGEKYKLADSQFGKRIRELCPEVTRKRLKKRQGRPWYLCFPSLEDCRKAFEEIINIKINWDEDD